MSTIADIFGEAIRLHQAGQYADAERLYRHVLQLEPRHADAHHQLACLALVAGQPQAALQSMSAALRLQPSQPLYHVSQAEALRRLGQADEAIAAYRQALALNPNLAIAHTYLGILYHHLGNLPEAAASFRETTRISPQDAQAYANLGRVQYDLGQLDQAEICFRRATMLAPDNPRAHYSLGSVLQALGKLDEACTAYQAALALEDNNADASNNLGVLMKEMNRLPEAEAHYRRAIELRPQFAAAYNNLAVVLGDEQRLDEAIAASRKAIALAPAMGEAYGNLAGFLHGLGRLDEAIASYRQAIALRPDDSNLQSNLLYALNYHPGLSAPAIAAEHFAWGARFADPLTAQAAPLASDRSADRRLRIGYVSAHFKLHAVNFFVEPILAAHDHVAVEVFCYSDVAAPDATTERLRGHADQWRHILGLTDEQAADVVRRDQIDVLVDLTGHIFGGNRLLMFARKPAPVQVTYIGYQNTTGMRAMDYRLTDDWADPPGTTDACYTEELWRLPEAFFCYLPSRQAPDVGPPPFTQSGHITFGSFNHFGKITPQVLAAWAQILRAVPESRLVLLAPAADSLRQAVIGTFEQAGVGRNRIELIDRLANIDYLRRLNTIDIALDSFPFNGHTTTCDCLWMGVPVVMLAGDSYVSRYGGTALRQLGLEPLIAGSAEHYIATAIALAHDTSRLAELRAGLRPRMSSSVLVDGPGFTRRLEQAYRQMWARWCAQAPA